MIYKILLVEPTDSWQSILKGKIKNALEEIGHSDDPIKTITNFKDSLDALQDRENHWDLLVTDVSLGTTQKLGIELVDCAKQIHLPTIAISGSPDVNTCDVCTILIDLQASYFFSKQDFDRIKFKAKIKELLRETPPPTQDDSTRTEEISIYGLGTEDRECLVNTLARLATAHPIGAINYFRDVVRRLSLPQSWENNISDIWTGDANGDARMLINWLEQRKDFPSSCFKQDYTILGAMIENLLKDSGDRKLLEIIQRYKLITNKDKLEALKHEYGARNYSNPK